MHLYGKENQTGTVLRLKKNAQNTATIWKINHVQNVTNKELSSTYRSSPVSLSDR
jgi:hypothetical protein